MQVNDSRENFIVKRESKTRYDYQIHRYITSYTVFNVTDYSYRLIIKVRAFNRMLLMKVNQPFRFINKRSKIFITLHFQFSITTIIVTRACRAI